MLSRFRMLLMSVAPEEIRFKTRGFPETTPQKTAHLEAVAETFLVGYHSAIQTLNQIAVATALEASVGSAMRGFAYEGAAMGFAVVDLLTPWKKNRLERFVCQVAASHHYMSIVGAGWAYARLKRRLNAPLDYIDPVFGWLVIDGYGFHEGFFDWGTYYQQQVIPAHMSAYTRQVFDQGLGRALWFVAGADIPRIESMLYEFPRERRADLWSGVGLAATYAGGVTPEEIRLLQAAAGEYVGNLAQGAVFAATARHRAGNSVQHNQMACEILSGLSVPEAAELVDRLLATDVSPPSELPPYEVLRRSIVRKLEKSQV